MFCLHKWKIEKETYNPPRSNFKTKNSTESLIEVLTYGITNVTQKCQKCGKIEIEKCVGKR